MLEEAILYLDSARFIKNVAELKDEKSVESRTERLNAGKKTL